jgi:general secretion pathway protein G
MKRKHRKLRTGFTLVEVMVVIAIIVILAALVIGGTGFVKESQDKKKAQVQIALLSKAIEEYKLDMGAYPGTADTDVNGDVSEQLYQALFKDGYDYTNPASPPAPWTKATKIYLPELDPRTSKMKWVDVSTAVDPPISLKIKDPWGANYRYRIGTNAQNPDFDLWSLGKDGKTDASNPAMSVEVNKDDIRNF